MDTTNLRISYFTDSLTFSRRLVLAGADPSHTTDLKKMGGEFHYYLDGGMRGWVFSVKMEPYVTKYIQTGKVSNTIPKKKSPSSTLKKKGPQQQSGVCRYCKNKETLDTAVKNIVCYRAGGLPKKVTNLLMDAQYRSEIAEQFEDDTFVCVECLRKKDKETLDDYPLHPKRPLTTHKT